MSERVRALSLSELPEEGAVRVELGGTAVCVARSGGTVYAIGDRCSHAEASLAEGEVWPDECEIECPKHGSAFSLKTGEPFSLPATQPVPTYTVRVDGDDVLVRV